MPEHRFPYDELPAEYYWRAAYSDPAQMHLDPQGASKFRFERDVRLTSAGSCFARRIASSLRRYGFDYVITEPGPAWLDESEREAYSYGAYSARWGDLFTPAHLQQLLLRALGRFSPLEDSWTGPKREIIDPFRPLIQPDGFASIAELHEDRSAHFAATLRAFEQSEVFIFTLGLTEAWVDVRDGAIFPVCPGRGRGTFDPSRVAFKNFDVNETIRALEDALALAWEINPRLRVILTVSPIPLTATYAGPHVIRATTYSKSVLRVAAESVARNSPSIDYFASYETVMSGGFREPIFATGARAVTETGVEHVMRLFYRHYFGLSSEQLQPIPLDPVRESVVKPCDEEQLFAAIKGDFVA